MKIDSRRDLLIAFSGIMLATLLAALDQTIVATALPRIASDLGAFDRLSWVVTAYLLTATITIPLYGKLSDIFGRRRLFVVAIGLFLGGSVLCAIATTLGQLIGFRALQGLGAGGLIPLSQAAIGDLFPPRERGRYQGFIGSMWAAAAVMGPLLGGVLTDNASWRWIFLINIPLGAAALIAVVRTMPAAGERKAAGIDWAGAVLLSLATVGLLLVCVWGGSTYSWDSAPVLIAAGLGVAAAVALGAVERRAAEPFVPFRLLRSPVPRVTAIGAAMVGILMFAITIYAPVFVQGVLGRSATASGTVLIPLTLTWVASAFLCGQLVSRTGRYRVFPRIGGCLVVAGTLLLTRADEHTSSAALAATLMVTGAGMGMTWPVYMVAVQNAVPRSELGTASGALLFARTMAGSVGIALLGAVLSARLDDSLVSALHAVFVLLLPVAVVQLLVAVVLEERPLRSASEKQGLTHHTSLDTVAR